MKKIKSVLSLLLCFTLILSLLVPAFAAELTADGTSASTVAHTVNAEFTAEIPAYIVPTEQGQADARYTVTLDNAVIPDGQELTAKVEYSGTMCEQNGVELPYELLDETGNTISSGAKILSKSAGTPTEAVSVSFGAALTAKARYAGVYTDTATFAFDVVEQTYTLDDINADTHLYGIGKTKSEYVIAKFNANYSEVTIFKNGENSDGLMRDWDSAGYYYETNPFVQNKDTLQSAVIQEGVLNIGSYAFGRNMYSTEGSLYCKELTNITISDSVTDIGDYAFFSTSLINVTVPKGVISIGTFAFSHCESLKNISLGNNITSIGTQAFYGCNKLSNIEIPYGVKRIESQTFSWCESLTSVILPDSVISIGESAFCMCKSLINISIPKSVTSIEKRAFADCSSLTNISISNGVTSIGEAAFLTCKSLTSITIPDSVTSIGEEAFALCFSLQNIKLSESISQIPKCLFEACYALENIEIPKSVTSIDTTAFRSSGLKTIYGVLDSYAETFAAQNGYTFIAQ